MINIKEKPLIIIKKGLKIRVLEESEYQKLIQNKNAYFKHNSLGECILFYRKKAKMNQGTLAQKCSDKNKQISQSTISRIESGKIKKVKFLNTLKNILGKEFAEELKNYEL